MTNIDQVLDSLVIKATSEFETEPDWMTNVQITDYLERNPDDYSKIILYSLLKRFKTEVKNTQILSLTVRKIKFIASYWICA